MKAIWNGKILAESEDTVVVEGNHYFPPESINKEFFRESSDHTFCPWKGTASYFDIDTDGKINPGAAWYYPDTYEAAKHIEGRIAFWKGVEVIE